MSAPPRDPSQDLRVRFVRLPSGRGLPLPTRATPDAAGYDIRSASPDFDLRGGEIRAVATGLVLELPPGVECQVRPRSGLALKKSVTVANAPGTIDPDYRGEVKVILVNLGKSRVRISRGDRIAQLVFSRFETPEIEETEGITGTERGAGGLGSTGLT